MGSDQRQQVKLQDVCQSVCDGDWIETKDQGGSDYRLLQISNIGLGKFVETGKYRWITSNTFEALKCSEILKGDILIARMPEPTGRCWWVDNLPWRAVTAVDVTIARPRSELVDGRFLAYYINSPSTLATINGLTTGTTRMRVRRADLADLDLYIPSLTTQKAIAHILGTIDDKIELNRKINKTLEGIAKALFKSWFVDFDPVRAKTEGRPTGLPDEISDLFPDSFEESELGEIPSGWEVVGLNHYLLLQRGFDLPAKQRIKGAYPVVAASGISGSHNSPMAKAPGVVTGRSGVLGNVFFVQQDFFPLNTTLWVKEFYSATPVFGYFLLGTIDFSVFNAGSAVPTLNRNHLGSLRFASPADPLIRCFTQIAVPLMEALDLKNQQVETLEQIRNALLPRLISGELRVPDSEKMLEEVGI